MNKKKTSFICFLVWFTGIILLIVADQAAKYWAVSKLKETIIPVKKQNSEITTELIITPLKFLNNLIDVNDGKIISAEISSVPITLIPITIVKAVRTAITIL